MAMEHPSHLLHAQSSEAVESTRDDEKITVWVFLWTLFCFKIATVAAIFWASHSWEAGVLLTVTTWPFLILPAVAVAGPAAFYVRLRRVRRRRAQLRRAEWMVDDRGEEGFGARS